jgi:hypothetical protein
LSVVVVLCEMRGRTQGGNGDDDGEASKRRRRRRRRRGVHESATHAPDGLDGPGGRKDVGELLLGDVVRQVADWGRAREREKESKVSIE